MGFKVIKCPHCGREYLPVEIFYPASFFGKPTTVYRDEQGKIENIETEYERKFLALGIKVNGLIAKKVKD